jgi:hypothetical protein
MQFGEEAVFIDTGTIKPGDVFPAAIERALQSADIMVVLIGQRWLSGASHESRIDDPQDYVRHEVETALRRGIRTIPVLVDEASLPSHNDLPDGLKAMLTRQTFRIRTETFSANAGELVRSIESGIDASQRPKAADVEREEKLRKIKINQARRIAARVDYGTKERPKGHFEVPTALAEELRPDEQVEDMIFGQIPIGTVRHGSYWIAATNQRLLYFAYNGDIVVMSGQASYPDVQAIEATLQTAGRLWTYQYWRLEILTPDNDRLFEGRNSWERVQQLVAYVKRRVDESQ